MLFDTLAQPVVAQSAVGRLESVAAAREERGKYLTGSISVLIHQSVRWHLDEAIVFVFEQRP